MILRVKLKNFRSHLNSELNFSSGTNALLGHLGSGKSSILEAICFGFFGTTPLLQSRKLKLNDLLMNKPIIQNKAEVEVEFKVNEKSYSVKRIIERDKGTTYAEFRENGKLIEAGSAQRVTEMVEKILKVDYELFSKIVYSEQNALDYFLTIPRGQRMKKMDELLMIDKFENARTGCASLINTLANLKAGKEEVISTIDLDGLKKIISELKESLETDATEAASIKTELENLQKKIIEQERFVKELKLTKEQLEALKRDEQAKTAAIEELKRDIDALEDSLKNVDSNKLEKRIKEVTEFIKDAEEFINEKILSSNKLRVQISKNETEANYYLKEIAKKEKELNEKLRIKQELEQYKRSISEDIEKDLENSKKLEENLVSEIEGTKARIKDLTEMMQQIASIGAKCPVCESKLTQTKKRTLIKQRKAKADALKEHLEDLLKKKKILETKIKELEDAKKKWEEIEKDLEDLVSLQKECETLKNMYSVISENLKKAEKDLSTVEKELNEVQKNYKLAIEEKQNIEKILVKWYDYTNKKKRIAILLDEREKIVNELVNASQKLHGIDLNREESNLTSMLMKERELSAKLDGLKRLIEEKTKRLNEFEATAARIERDKKDIEKLERLILSLKIFEKALQQVQTELRREFITSVNYTMNKIWPTLYPYRDFEGIQLNVEEGDYVLQLKSRGGVWVNVEGVVSGGERSLACLALRIAFSLVLAPQLKILVLDEPTHNLDEKSVETLAITFRERITEFIDQIFIISHDPKIEEAVTGRIYRLERDKAKEEPTRIISL